MSVAPVLIVILLLAVCVFAVVSYLKRPAAELRIAAVERLARRLGWGFLGAHKFDGLDALYPQFDQFDRGHARHAHNRLGGRIRAFGIELSAEAGDYCYEIAAGAGGHSTRTCRFSYLLVTLPFGPLLPSIRVQPVNFVDQLASRSGFIDIDLESLEFSRRHRVSSDNPRFTQTLMDPRMIGFLLSTPPPLFQLGGGVLLIVSPPGADDSRWRPEDLARAVAWAGDFLSRWPGYLVSDLRARC